MLSFMFESILVLASIVLVSYLIGLFMAWTVDGNWIKRYFFGYPIQFIFYNVYAVLAWILTMIGDLVFSFVRFIYNLISDGSGRNGDVDMYLNTDQSRDNALAFWFVVCNLVALYLVCATEKRYIDDKKRKKSQELKAEKLAEIEKSKDPRFSYVIPDSKLQDKMNADLDKFNKKFNIQ